MKEFDDSPSNDPKKERNTTNKHKPSFKLLTKNFWPKIMMSRDNTIYKKTTDSTENSSYSFLEEHLRKFQTKEKKILYDVEHLYCNETDADLEEEQRTCLITSSSEIQLNSIVYGVEGKGGENLKNLDEPITDHTLIFSPAENEIPKASNEERPIFVDLTTDDKNTSRQKILNNFCDRNATVTNERETEKKKSTKNIALEHRIMIADSSSKASCNGTGSIATALRDRGPCLIPVQPNRSLPIRPVPSVPTRSYRKDCTSLLISPKSSNLNMDESVKSIHTLSNKDVYSRKNINPVKQISSKDSVLMVDVPQISNTESANGTTKRDRGDTVNEKDYAVKEHGKRKRSQETDCNQFKPEGVEYAEKMCLRNLCDPNASEGMQNLYADKSSIVVSMSRKENGNKVVPPLRLKKIVRTESETYNSSQTVAGAERESKYRIITNIADQSLSSTSSTNWSDMLYEKDTNFVALNTDSYKLKYRRNRLKQKLRELRSKALDLAKQMTDDSNPQRSTRLRQVMNRYEKQIENLTKLHSKLSAALPVFKEVIDVNDDSTDPLNDACSFAHLNETSAGSIANDSSPRSSPEPPKLSPRSPTNYDNVLQEEGPDSPPILPRICLAISSNQESTEEELQVTKKKVWPVNEKSLKTVHLVNSSDTDTMLSCPEKNAPITPLEQQNNIIVDIENTVPYGDNESLYHSQITSSYPEKNCIMRTTHSEMNKSLKGFPQCCHVVKESEKMKYPSFSDSGPVINSRSNDVGVVQENEMFDLLPGKEVNSSTDRVLHSNSYESVREDVPFSNVDEASPNVQKVTSSTGQSTQLHNVDTMLNQEKPQLQQNYKEEGIYRDSAQRNTDSHSLTEQFPTLGNWLARISKKQVSRSNSKEQTGANVPLTSAENNAHMKVPEFEMPKPAGTHTIDDGVNAASSCNTNKWQYHHHQQQQQLLQHVASSVTLSQPIATIPPLRPRMCPPMPINQFYPNNYAIDPYNNSALTYHPTICPYGTYPYHNRIHSSSLPAYHSPMHDNLRAIHHADKRFPTMQEPMARYPPPSMSTLQHRSNLEFDLRRNSGNNHVTTATCLSSLFLPPPTLSPSHQSQPRPPLLTYPTNGQFSRSRMIPDVVAAAAAAAVVAAASFGRQRDTLTYNRANMDALSTTDITNVIDAEPGHAPGPHKSVIAHPDVSNHQVQDGNFNEEAHENTKYEQMQNFLLDHLTFVKTADNLTQTNASIDNDSPVPVAPIISTTPYRMSLIQSHTQSPKNISGNETRNCETPHLGKMNRSPDSLHNFACSNCGTVGPKFKCLGCEMAFYCGERCQEKHWYVHVQKCPKKMPKLKKVA